MGNDVSKKKRVSEPVRARARSNGQTKKTSSARSRRLSGSAPRAAGSARRPGRFPIVGIGASAGGLAALTTLLATVPRDSGLALVVVVHLAPERESHLEELLQPHVEIPVRQVRQTVALEPNRVYLIPPNANLDTIDTHLRLTELEKSRQQRAPIDHFFRTLAQTHDGDSIGVVLTGTGSDGTLGLRRIKECGGLTIVQDPEEAEYDGMPRTAIAAAPVDMVLPLSRMIGEILQFTQTAPRVAVPRDEEPPDKEGEQLLHNVFAQIRARTGRDFTHYKRSTLLRRITRRMQFHHLQEPSAYVELLRKQPEEVRALADDLLITVTSFFRDTDVHDTLSQSVIPQLFHGKGGADSVRAWCVGCATGEEAYSLAILLLEEAARHETAPSIQVFASDLHTRSLEKAREGLYPGDIDADVRPERLKRYFQRESGGYRVRKEVRELVIFAPHNVLSDPPFSRLDLISCRNLLIYLQRHLQQQVTELFHYALQPDGFLLLGSSETVDATDLFRLEDKKRCIFRKRNVPAREPRLPVFPFTRMRRTDPRLGADAPREPVAYELLHQRLLEQHGPPSILIGPDDHVVHFSPRAGRYFIHPGGAPTTNVFKLVREELRIELRAALHAARTQGQAVRTKPVRARFDDALAPVVMVARAAPETEHEGFVLLIFNERPADQAPARGRERGRRPDGASAEGLRELETAKLQAEQQLQALIEEYETSQEETQASNEELQSANEELRSTLEELETSKEELQSMNEELQTVNQENRHKVEELAQLSSDLQNLLVATDIATLFLDRELRILRFTPGISELFNVRASDRGRPLSDFTHRLGYDLIQSDALSVLDRLIPVERETRDVQGRWYLTRVLPYRAGNDRIAGVVVTFVDITQQKAVEEELRRAKAYLEQILEALPEPLLVLRPSLEVESANAAFLEHFDLTRGQIEGRKIYDLGRGQWNIPALRELLERVLGESDLAKGYLVDQTFEDLGRRVMLLNARRAADMQRILLGIHDITERFAAEQAVRTSEARYRSLAELSPEAILVSVDERYVFANAAAVRMLGAQSTEQVLEHSPLDVLDPQIHELVRERVRGVLNGGGSPQLLEHPWRRLDGEQMHLELIAGPVEWEGKSAVQIVARDVSDRKRAELALRESEQRYRRLFESIDEGFCVIEVMFDAAGKASDYRLLEVNPAFEKQIGIEEPVGRRMREIAPDHDELWFEAFGRVARTGDALRFEGNAAALDRCYDVYAFRVGHAEERQVAVLFNDISARKRLEAQLRESASDLAEANRRKDEYLAMLGHELRNPLAAIRGATEIMERHDGSDARLRGAREVLERQTSHMACIVDGLLDVSRIVHGKIRVEMRPLDVRELVQRVVHDKRTQILGRGLSLQEDIAPEPLRILGDDTRLTQVLENLIGNAIKFTDPPGVIAVSVRGDDAWASIVVRDSGVGIRPELLSRIFETFQQEQQDESRSAGGLGLGLALAKGLVELQNGSIEAHSEGPGTGAEFRVRLPLSQVPIAEEAVDERREAAPRRILLVEDNADIAEVLKNLLADKGHQVTVVGTGAAALDALRERGADIVLCDLGLPGMSGYDLARAVRADTALREVPLVAVTGYGQRGDRERTRQAGFDEHLLKPIKLAMLEGAIARLGAGRPDRD